MGKIHPIPGCFWRIAAKLLHKTLDLLYPACPGFQLLRGMFGQRMTEICRLADNPQMSWKDPANNLSILCDMNDGRIRVWQARQLVILRRGIAKARTKRNQQIMFL